MCALGTLVTLTAPSVHHLGAAHAVGRSAIVIDDVAQATVASMAHSANTSIIVLAEYMIDTSPKGSESAARGAEYMID